MSEIEKDEIDLLFPSAENGGRSGEPRRRATTNRLQDEYDRRRPRPEDEMPLTMSQVQLLVMAIFVIVKMNWSYWIRPVTKEHVNMFPNDYHFLITLARMGRGPQDPDAKMRLKAFYPHIKARLEGRHTLPQSDEDAMVLISCICWLINRASVENQPSRQVRQRGIYEKVLAELRLHDSDFQPLPIQTEEDVYAAREESHQLEQERIAKILVRTAKAHPASATGTTPHNFDKAAG